MPRALVVTGDGVGNAIQSTPAILLLLQRGYEVDLLIPGAPKDIDTLFMPTLGIVRCSTNVGTFAGTAYDLVSCNWMFENVGKRFRSKKLIVGKAPIPAKISESYSHWSSLEEIMRFKVAELHEMPETWVCWKTNTTTLGDGVHLAMHMGSKTNYPWMMKRYPGYSKAVQLLLEWIPELKVHVFGAEGDSWIQGSLMAGAGGSIVEYHSLPLVEVAGMIRLCDAFLGNDAGLSHISAAVKTPTAIVYGPTEVRKNLPPYHAIPITSGPLQCRPCHRRKIGHYENGSKCHHECLHDLQPEHVARVVYDMLERNR